MGIKSFKVKMMMAFMMLFSVWQTSTTQVKADESVESFVMGPKYIYRGHYVDFGVYNGSPVNFEVLNEDGYIYSAKIIRRFQFDNPQMPTQRSYNLWVGSVAEYWCEDIFYAESFSSIEQGAIVPVTKTDSEITVGNTTYVPQRLENNHIYFLSVEELLQYYPTPESRHADMLDGTSPNYWTRSPAHGYGVFLGNVAQSCDTSTMAQDYAYTYLVINLGAGHGLGARPALNLDLDKILFMTPSNGGKQSSSVGEDSLTKVENIDNNNWKLTLEDSTSSFSATLKSMEDGVATIEYSGAYTDTNGYVSAIITDGQGSVKYYGNLSNNSETGTQTVKIPDDCTDGEHNLVVFTEQKNSNGFTDYAKISLNEPIGKQYKITFDSNGGSQVDKQTVNDGDLIEKPEDPTRSGYIFKGWYYNDTLYDFDVAPTTDMTLVAKWEENKTCCVIRYNLDGGVLEGKSNFVEYTVSKGQEITIPKAPTKQGYKFLYWEGSRYYPGDKYIVQDNHTFTARYQQIITNVVVPNTSDK